MSTTSLHPADIAKEAREFVKENKSELFRIYKPILMLLMVLAIYNIFLYLSYSEDTADLLSLPATILSSYATTVLIVSWHRYYILGPESEYKLSLWPIHGAVFKYLWVWVALFVASFIAGIVITFLTALLSVIHPLLFFIAAFIGVLALIYIGVRICLLFPAISVGNSQGVLSAYRQGRGLTLSFMSAGVRAMAITLLKYLGSFILLLIVAAVIGGGAMFTFMAGLESGSDAAPNAGGMGAIIIAILVGAGFYAIYLYFLPIFTALGVTVLSKYYVRRVEHGIEPS